ncbi:MAG: hypothetical protein ACR2G2_00515 [Pseudonocardia sp.]
MDSEAQKNRSGVPGSSSTMPMCSVFSPRLRFVRVADLHQPQQVVLEDLVARRAEQHSVVHQLRSLGEDGFDGIEVDSVAEP